MAKNKARTLPDKSALLDEVTELEALVKRRKKAERDLRDLEEGDEADPDEAAPLPGSELIEQVMTELGGDGSFSIVKLEGGKTMDMGTHDLTLWPDAMEELVKVQGGGNYVLIFRRPDGTIAKRIKRTYPASLYPPAAKEPASGSGDMLAMLKIMEDRDARREAQNETLRLEAMKGQQAMMTAMMTMMGSQNKPLINNATELATIAKLFGDNKKGTDLKELVALKDLLDDLREGNDDGAIKVETDNPLVALVAPILAALGKSLNNPRPAPKQEAPPVPPAAPPAVIAAPAPQSSPAPTVAKTSPAPEESGLLEHANMLRTAIDAGVTPQIAADKAWEDAESKGQGGMLVDLIEKGDWEGLKKHPDLSKHSAWLDAFREALRAGAIEEVPPVVEPEKSPEAAT